MIYNNGEFLGTPWEVVIKQYRLQLNETSFPTLAEYKDDFVRYLHAKNFSLMQFSKSLCFYYMIFDFNVILMRLQLNRMHLFKHNP